jgi:hypothetical protein
MNWGAVRPQQHAPGNDECLLECDRPNNTACGTISVKTSQVVFGANDQWYFGQAF